MAAWTCSSIIALSHWIVAPGINATELFSSHGPAPSGVLHAVTVGSSIDALLLEADIAQALKCRGIGNMCPRSVCSTTRGSDDNAFLAFSRTRVSVSLEEHVRITGTYHMSLRSMLS